MRILVRVLAPLLVVTATSAQTAPSNTPGETADEQSGFCPRTHNLEAHPSARYWLDGVIGSKTARMYLDRGGSGVVGLFYEPNGDWKPVLLGGMWKPSRIDLSAWDDGAAFEPETSAPIGHLQGQLADNVLLGQWMPAGNDHAEPVRLSVVPRASCAGKGKWKRFDNPKWPFSFSYPASWKLVEKKEPWGSSYIRLICPDPEEMAYDTDVTVSEGLGDPSASKQTGLVRCGKEWRYDAGCGDDISQSAFGHIPSQSVRHGMRILDISDHEWRLYCRNGGYVGQSDGTDLVALQKNGWINITGEGGASDIVERIVDTVRPHTRK